MWTIILKVKKKIISHKPRERGNFSELEIDMKQHCLSVKGVAKWWLPFLKTVCSPTVCRWSDYLLLVTALGARTEATSQTSSLK